MNNQDQKQGLSARETSTSGNDEKTQTLDHEGANAQRGQALPIKKVKLGEIAYGVIFGPAKYIISTDECIHFVNDNSEAAEMRTGWVSKTEFQPKFEKFTLDELKARAEPMDLAEWVHYWGIKQRMAHNYALLRKSMREIGVSDDNMPAYGEGL